MEDYDFFCKWKMTNFLAYWKIIHNDLLNSHNFTKFPDTGIGQCLTVWFGMFLDELLALQSPRQTFLFKGR